MYFGWKDRGVAVNSYECEIAALVLSNLNRPAIWEGIESLIATGDGEKLTEKPDEVGAPSAQFNAQQRRAIPATWLLSRLSALSQHFIIPIFSECTGIPANAPPAIAKRRINDVSHLFMVLFDYMELSTACQRIHS